jgi:hypothetical protein
LRTFPGDKRWGALSLAGYGGEDDEAGETKKPITSGSREAFINALGVACCGNAMVGRNASRQSPRMAPERQSPCVRPFLVHGDLPDVGLVLDSATSKIEVAGVQVQDSSGSEDFLTYAAAMTTRLWKILDI